MKLLIVPVMIVSQIQVKQIFEQKKIDYCYVSPDSG